MDGCGAHVCLIKKPQGQGNNGPCRCPQSRIARHYYCKALEDVAGSLKSEEGEGVDTGRIWRNTAKHSLLDFIEELKKRDPLNGD
jgi:hypothetical protein